MARRDDDLRGDRDDPTDELFALPPGEFVAARNRAAADLKKAGNKEAAAAVKAMAKPSASAWAVNQVARTEPAAMKRFLDISDDLRRAQTRGGASEEARREFQAAQASQREALDRILEIAQSVLRSAGVGASRVVVDRVANNLRWGPLSDEARALMARGRLTHDVAPPDFSALLGRIPLTPAPSEPTGEPGPGKPDRDRERKPDRSAPREATSGRAREREREGGREDERERERHPDRDRDREREGERERERDAAAAARERARFLRAALAAAHSQEARARTVANRARLAQERAERTLEAARTQLARAEAEAAEAAREHSEADDAVSAHAAEVARLSRELEEAERG